MRAVVVVQYHVAAHPRVARSVAALDQPCHVPTAHPPSDLALGPSRLRQVRVVSNVHADTRPGAFSVLSRLGQHPGVEVRTVAELPRVPGWRSELRLQFRELANVSLISADEQIDTTTDDNKDDGKH